jgi:hypothetical protein
LKDVVLDMVLTVVSASYRVSGLCVRYSERLGIAMYGQTLYCVQVVQQATRAIQVSVAIV